MLLIILGNWATHCNRFGRLVCVSFQCLVMVKGFCLIPFEEINDEVKGEGRRADTLNNSTLRLVDHAVDARPDEETLISNPKSLQVLL